jgi:hypothetical protein
MRPIILIYTILLIGFISTSCDSVSSKESYENKTEINAQSIKFDDSQISSDLLGNYHGVLPSYFLKNQYGDDLIIAGNKVPVPSSDFKFLLKENNVVSMQQTSLEVNSRFYYDGTYKILNEDEGNIKIKCTLSDGNSSNPTFVLSLKKSEKKGICIGKNQPEFPIELNK